MKTIKGDLVLTKDTTFDESIKVEGDISGYFNLKVIGNIACRNIACRNIDCLDIACLNIDCLNIDCRDIACLNIDCLNIDCLNIACGNIDCRDIIYCETVKVKAGCKIKAKAVIRNRSKLPIKEWKHVTI